MTPIDTSAHHHRASDAPRRALYQSGIVQAEWQYSQNCLRRGGLHPKTPAWLGPDRQTKRLHQAAAAPSPDAGQIRRRIPPAPIRMLQRISTWYRRWRDARDRRDAFLYLLTLDEHMLSDIGVSREQVLQASRLPLRENAALQLRQAASRQGHG